MSIKPYENYLKKRRLQSASIQSYTWHIKKFLKWLDHQALNSEIVKKYHKFIVHSSEKINSINLHLIIVNDYLKFLDKKLKFDLLSNTETGKLPRLTQKQVDDFLQQPLSTPGLVGLRNRAMIELLYSTGLKVGQLVRLEKNMIDDIKNELIVAKRHIKIEVIPWSALKKYLEARKDSNNFLFINFDRSGKSSTGHISVRSVERIIKKYSQRLKPAISISPQILRNTLAHRLKQEGAPSQVIHELLDFRSKLSAQNFWRKI